MTPPPRLTVTSASGYQLGAEAPGCAQRRGRSDRVGRPPHAADICATCAVSPYACAEPSSSPGGRLVLRRRSVGPSYTKHLLIFHVPVECDSFRRLVVLYRSSNSSFSPPQVFVASLVRR